MKENRKKREKRENKETPDPNTLAVTKGKGDKGNRDRGEKGKAKGGSRGEQTPRNNPDQQHQKGNSKGDDPPLQLPYHYHWFHHTKGCPRTDCKFRHEKKISARRQQDLMALLPWTPSLAAPQLHHDKVTLKENQDKFVSSSRKAALDPREQIALMNTSAQHQNKTGKSGSRVLQRSVRRQSFFEESPDECYEAAVRTLSRKSHSKASR
jgi:hypothetical protein